MIITKIITYAIDVYDYMSFFTDAEANVRHVLEHRLRGRCYQGCFITDILRIPDIGDCIITQDGAPKYGTLSVSFEVRAVVYTPGEIITGCKVLSRDPTGALVCETKTAKIMVFNSASLAAVITPGQLISVTVVSAQQTLGASATAILAHPMMPSRHPTIFSIGQITPEIRATIAPALELAVAEDAKAQRENAVWKMFDDLLYAWVAAPATPTGAVVTTLKDLCAEDNPAPLWVSRDNRLRCTEPTLYKYATKPDVDVRDDLDTASALIVLINDWTAHLRTIREMTEVYSTPELISSHKNLWRIYAKMKL